MTLGGLHHSSGKDNWATPDKFFQTLNLKYQFQLDACAENWSAKCLQYYTEADNGLIMPWKTWTWCNPPYSQIRQWYEKAVNEMHLGNSSVLLTFARTDTQAFHDFALQASEIIFLQGRLRFVSPDTRKQEHPAPSPSIIAVFDSQHIAATRFSTLQIR